MATIQAKKSRGHKYWYIVESRRVKTGQTKAYCFSVSRQGRGSIETPAGDHAGSSA